jgi:hypothetical protein
VGVSDDRAFQEFVDAVRVGAVDKIAGSAAFVSLVPEGEVDIKFAVELGLAIWYGKPIVAVVMPGREIPSGLRRVAHRVVECDIDTQAGQEKFHEALAEVLDGGD